MNWVGELVRKELQPSDRVLDLGCGIMQATLDTCPNYPPTRIQCKEIVGVDAYEPYLKALEGKDGVKTLLHDITKPLPFADKSFDVCLLLDVLEHLTVQDARKLLQEAERVSRRKIIVLTPGHWISNDEQTVNVYGLGANPLQKHKILLHKSFLQKQGFKVSNPKRWHDKNNPMFAVKNFQLRILHVWDCAGVAACLCKYQRKLGHEAEVIVNLAYDGLSINRFYRNMVLKFEDKFFTKFPSILKKALMRLNRLQNSTMFYLYTRKLSKNYDIVHIHSRAFFTFFIPFKPKVLEFHGDDLRLIPSHKAFRFSKFINRLIAKIFYKKVFVSTPELVDEVSNAVWMPNPVDAEHFTPTNEPRPNTAFYTRNWYETSQRVRQTVAQHNLALTIVDRTKSIELIPYKDMPKFMQQFEYFIDRHIIPSLSKTALESLAMGLTVIRWDGKEVKGLNPIHGPEVVAKTWVEIYKELV